MAEKILEMLSRRYAQLLMPIAEGESKTEEYKDAVLRGNPPRRELSFLKPEDVLLEQIRTPAGTAEVVVLPDRQDFEHAYRALAYRCEPVEILPSVGAGIIRGLINWEKIRAHRQAYEAEGNLDWNEEFRRFTSRKENYCDTLILLSGGPYSDIPAEDVGMTPEAWQASSIEIRKYHELCHFVCQRKWPEDKDALRDEIYADCIGLLAAFGTYDRLLALRFLGLEGETFRPGGRLQHYAGDDLQNAEARARDLIREAEMRLSETDRGADLWETLECIYPSCG